MEEKDDEISIGAKKSKIAGTPENSDEEFSLDLGKIKNFFRRKKESKEVDVKPDEKKNEMPAETEKKDTEIIQETTETKQEEQKDDDEIAIDLSKIKKIFKKKESTTEGKTETKEGKEDDEISIDFSKIKNIKNIFKKSDKETESEEDVSVDYKKIFNFVVQHKILILLLIPIFLSIFLRVQSAYLPITDQWATDSVINNLRSQVSGQINQQYPNLPDQNRNVLIENEVQRVLREQRSQIDQQITATSNFFKSRLQDDSGQTYLLAIDPYFWMRYAKNILENGHPGDEIRRDLSWDNHMLAPFGRFVQQDIFHAYFEAYLFRFLSFFNRDLNLMGVIFFVPVLISALAVIPTFFITRKLAGNVGGFIAATIVAIHPSFLTRTAGGFADTDAYNVMFPLFITWIFLEALEAKDMRKNVFLSVLGGLLVGLYSATWGGWWYIFDFILASTGFFVVYYTLVHRKELKRNLVNFAKKKPIIRSFTFLTIFFVVSAFSVTSFDFLKTDDNFFQYFSLFATSPTGFIKAKEVGITTVWPNVLTTVAEQNSASLNDVINQVGLGGSQFLGSNFPLFFLISLMGIALTLATKGRKKLWYVTGTLIWYIIIFMVNVQNLNTFLILISIPIIIRILIALIQSDTEIDIKYAIFLILWFIATTFASTKGVRFTLLLVPAFSIGFGIALGQLYKSASSWITRGLQVNKYVSKTVVIIVLLSLLIAPYRSAANTARNEIPSFNDAWAISLEKIKEDSKPDAIINSWWDFGHWFKFWADRAVTFDGATQTTPQAHFVGNVLLTDDEDKAIGILRMLDCGATRAFSTILKSKEDFVDSINLLYKVIPEDKENAQKILSDHFNEDDTEKLLELTHCQPPEDYFITSEDMVGKSGVWAHFGSWNFDRAVIYNTLKKKEYKDLDKGSEFLQEKFDYSENDAENLFYEVQSITSSDQANSWIAPWPGYAGTTGCSRNEDILTCNNGFTINLRTHEASAPSQQGVIHPKKISFPTNEGIIVKEYNESVLTLQNGRELGFALIKNGENYELLQMDSDLTASMFTRLFYQDGIGLKYFKKFSDERSVFGGRIIVWKVDWEGKEKNIIEEPEPEDDIEAMGHTLESVQNEEIINETNASNVSQNT